ncbi:stimulator of interferon genes protein-like [Thalassophryne amazonica]|uniref:stimulator of interferon genes protein-like n=1 Tax=Thalassophryne amazonica TaxID=390379 RepID=UPI001470C97F|nr:stimulator of interferon genes protein-like [Thalassophryne amazonica]
MHSLSEQDAVVPRPRGNLPKLCALGMAAITIGPDVFSSPERIFNLVAMATLMLTLGPVVYGFCQLTEELLHHANTRYRGQPLLTYVLPACGLELKVLLTAALAGLMFYLTAHPLSYESQCWSFLFLLPASYLVLKSVGVLVSAAAMTHYKHHRLCSFA